MNPAWLEAPETTLFADRDGNTCAAYIKVRDAKTVRVEQPNPDFPAFLYIGADDLPVGIKLTAPISVEIRSDIRCILRADASGACAVERHVTHTLHPIHPRLLEPTLRQVDQASLAMSTAS